MNAILTRFLVTFLGSSSIAFAGLQFDTTRIEHQAVAGEKNFIAEYPFTNDGDDTVEIQDVKSSCGCTIPTLEKRTYAPGESGTIKAVFTYGSRFGKQQKRITVTSTEGPAQLLLSVDIPRRWQLDKKLLQWNPKTQSEPQSVHVDFFDGAPLEVQTVEINHDRFDLETHWSNDGKRLTLDLGVKKIDPAGTHRIEIVVKNAAGETMRIPFYIRLQA